MKFKNNKIFNVYHFPILGTLVMSYMKFSYLLWCLLQDFGDYQDGYYSVQTTEGDHIAALISGYIDIIMKKRQAKDNYGAEMEEESAMLEDNVSPSR